MLFKSSPFPLACVPWSWFWRQHWPITVPMRRLSRCWDVILRISYHLCNGLQTALISSQWTVQSGASCRSASIARESVTSTTSLSDSWRNGPYLTTGHHCCSYSVASSSACVCEGGLRTLWTLFMIIDEWSHCFIGDNWTYSPCCHGNLCFWRLESMLPNLLIKDINPQWRNHVFKVGVQFLGLGYYYPSTEKKLDRSTQFGAVGYIIALYLSKSYVKSWGSVQILWRSGPPDPQWLRPCT